MINRRNFLKYALGATASITALPLSALPLPVLAQPTPATLNNNLPAEEAHRQIRTISLYNVHTKESLKIAYHADGQNLESNLSKLNFFLRDHRQNEATLMDAQLFDQLWEIQERLGGDTVFEIISAYRSPKTNAMLRASSSNVAQKSYHIRGRALDIRAQGVSIRKLRDQAKSLNAGGVGYYPRSSFIHIDTGPVRTWRA